MTGEKLYCGSAKARETQYGEELTVSVDLTECEKHFKEHGYISKAGNHFITLKVQRRKEVGKYGETHTVIIDTWKPEKRQEGASSQSTDAEYRDKAVNASKAQYKATNANSGASSFTDDIPF